MADTLKVTLVKSPISAKPKHRASVEALGLRKLNKTVELPNNAATLGMVKQVQNLEKVEEAKINIGGDELALSYLKPAEGSKDSDSFR